MADVWQSLLAGLGSGLSSGTQAYQQADQARKQQGLDQLKMAISMGDRNLAGQAIAQAYAPDPLSRLLFGEKPMGYVAPKQSVPTQPAAQTTAIPVPQALATTPQPAANPMAALLGTPTPVDADLSGGPMVVQPLAIANAPAPPPAAPAPNPLDPSAKAKAVPTRKVAGPPMPKGFQYPATAPAPLAMAAQPSPATPAAPTTPPVSNAAPSMWLDEHTVNPEWVDRYVMPHALPGEADLLNKELSDLGIKNVDVSKLTPDEMTQEFSMLTPLEQAKEKAAAETTKEQNAILLKKIQLQSEHEDRVARIKTEAARDAETARYHQVMARLDSGKIGVEEARLEMEGKKFAQDAADKKLSGAKSRLETDLREKRKQAEDPIVNADAQSRKDQEDTIDTAISDVESAQTMDDLTKVLANMKSKKGANGAPVINLDFSNYPGG